jgi:hypothetical protein
LFCSTNWQDHGSRAHFLASSAIVTSLSGRRDVRLRRTVVTCSKATKVTIYNCRI